MENLLVCGASKRGERPMGAPALGGRVGTEPDRTQLALAAHGDHGKRGRSPASCANAGMGNGGRQPPHMHALSNGCHQSGLAGGDRNGSSKAFGPSSSVERIGWAAVSPIVDAPKQSIRVLQTANRGGGHLRDFAGVESSSNPSIGHSHRRSSVRKRSAVLGPMVNATT